MMSEGGVAGTKPCTFFKKGGRKRAGARKRRHSSSNDGQFKCFIDDYHYDVMGGKGEH